MHISGLKDFFLGVLKDVLRTSGVLFKIMIPVSIVVKILQELGAITFIGDMLYPVMKYVGLPGEFGLVWATGMITNLFGGIIAFISISDGFSLSVAQVTTLAMMMLVAHTFPIELPIARRSGVRIPVMFIIRFGFGFLFGWIIFKFSQVTGWYSETAHIAWKPNHTPDPSLMGWIISQLKNYLVILCFIFCLILLIRILKLVGILDAINKGLTPFLRFLGIGGEVATIALVGLTLGIVYGGALIINEAKTNPRISKKDVFYALTLMGLCHSVIEDTILMVSLGASFFGVFVIRLILAVLVVFLLVKLTQFLSEKSWNRFLIRPI
jgi:hypothetical protein